MHAPDVLVLQDMSQHGTRRARRIKELNQLIAKRAERQGIPVFMYLRAQILERFADQHGAMTKQKLAEATFAAGFADRRAEPDHFIVLEDR